MVVEHPPTDPPAMIPAQAEKLLASWAERDREGWTGAAIVYDEDARPCLPDRKEKWRYPTGKEAGILALRPSETRDIVTQELISTGEPVVHWDWVGVNRGVGSSVNRVTSIHVDVERRMLVVIGSFPSGNEDRFEVPILGTPEQIADLAGPIAPTKHVKQASLEAWAS